MGAKIRPLICDFAGGEIDAENDGRVDLEVASHSCIEMTNMLPGEIGMASKRGGFKYLCAAIGAARVIEWNISEDVSILICFYDGYIKLMRLMPDGALVTLSYETRTEGADTTLTISHLDGDKALVDAYSYSDAKYIKYAQNLKEITLVCAGKYPAFFMRSSGLSLDGKSISIDYGVYSYTGNVAKNPKVATSNVYNASEVSADDFCDKFADENEFARGTAYTPAEGSYWIESSGSSQVVHTISSVVVNGAITPRHFSMSIVGNGWNLWKKTIDYSSGVDSDSLTLGFDLNVGTTGNDVTSMMPTDSLTWAILHETEVSPVNFNLTAGSTYRQILDKFAQYYDAHSNILLADNDGGRSLKVGSARFYPYNNTLSVELTDTNGVRKTIASTSGSTIKCNISFTNKVTTISGGITDATDLLNYIIPWMDKNRTYPCSRDYRICGRTVILATRDDSGAFPALILTTEDRTTKITINRSSPGVFGQVGVILTPFYDASEYPTGVCYHQNRLCLACRNVIYISKTNDYSNFCYFEEIEYNTTKLKDSDEWNNPNVPETETIKSFSQQIGDSSAMKIVLATDENEDIEWMVSDGALFVGTRTTEWIMPAGVNANKISFEMIGRMGSTDMQARYLMGMLMFASRNSQAVHAYNLSGGIQEENNLMFYARHIARAGIVDFDYRQDPQAELLVTLRDGTLLVMRKGKLGVSWCRVKPSGDGQIISTAVINAVDEDAIICLVKRGSAYGFERLVTADDSVFPTDSVTGRAHLDSYVASTISGNILAIPRMAGMTARIHLDYGDVEVRGSVTFNEAGVASSYIRDRDTTNTPLALPNLPSIVGFAYNSVLKPCRLDSSQTEGLVKGAGKIHMRVYESGAFKLVHDGVDYAIEPPVNSSGVVPYPYTGPIKLENPAGDTMDAVLDFESNDGVPLNIQLIVPDYSVGEVG